MEDIIKSIGVGIGCIIVSIIFFATVFPKGDITSQVQTSLSVGAIGFGIIEFYLWLKERKK